MKKSKKNIISIIFTSIILILTITSTIPKGYGISEFPTIRGEVELIHEISGPSRFFSVSPTEEKIMYGYYKEDYFHNQLVLINIDGSNKTIIGENITYNMGTKPIFNSKGTHILYYTNSRIALYDIDTTQTTYISPKNNTYPTIPDDWIPFAGSYSWDSYDISDNNIVFSFNWSIFVTDYQGMYENAIYSGGAFNPRLSHDGSKIIFTTPDYGGTGQSLQIIDMNGTNRLTLANYSSDYSFLKYNFNFNDSKIYITIEATEHPIESDNGIWVVNSDGSGLTKLIEGDYSFSFFHPNNEYFYYLTNTWAHRKGLERMNVDGSNITEISSPGDDWGLYGTDINPQGTQLVSSKWSDSVPELALWIMNHDGTDKKPIICGVERPSYPRFYSNGSKIMFYELYNSENPRIYSFDLLLAKTFPRWISGYVIPVFFLCHWIYNCSSF